MYIGKKLCVVLVVRVLLKWKLSDLHPTSLQEWLSVTKIVKIKNSFKKSYFYLSSPSCTFAYKLQHKQCNLYLTRYLRRYPMSYWVQLLFLNMYNVAWIIFGVAPGVYTETVHHNLNEPKCEDTPEK